MSRQMEGCFAMVRDANSWHGKYSLESFCGRHKADEICQILSDCLVLIIATHLDQNHFIQFLQDNASIDLTKLRQE